MVVKACITASNQFMPANRKLSMHATVIAA